MKIIESILIAASVIVIVVLSLHLWISASQLEQPGPDALIPTRGDIQQALLDAGYDIGPKGVDCDIGDDSNEAWRQYEIDTFTERLKQPAP